MHDPNVEKKNQPNAKKDCSALGVPGDVRDGGFSQE